MEHPPTDRTYPEHQLVGVTTEQATANLVPALMLGVGGYLAVDSETAAREQWGAGLALLLEQRLGPGQHTQVSLGPASTIEAIMAVVRDAVGQSAARPRAWCLGGGTKPHQIAVWRLFVERFQAGHTHDLAVYAEPRERKTFVISLGRDGAGALQLHEASFDTRVTLEVAELLRAFGREGAHQGAAGLSPLPATIPEAVAEYARFRSDPGYRQAWFALGVAGPRAFLASQQGTMQELLERLAQGVAKQRMLESLRREIASQSFPVKPLRTPEYLREWPRKRPTDGGPRLSVKLSDDRPWIENLAGRCLGVLLSSKQVSSALDWTQPPSVSNPLTNGNHFAKYFEALVAHRVGALRDPARFPDGRVNVSVRRAGTVRDEQEHDVLLSTSTATLLSLDAKTFDAELKDINSRLLQTRLASGNFSKFVLVIPYFVEDFAQGWVPGALQELPFFCKKNSIPFVVIGPGDERFRVRRNQDTRRVEVVAAQTPDAVECCTLEHYLKTSV